METINNEQPNFAEIEKDFVAGIGGDDVPPKEEVKIDPSTSSPRVAPKPRTGFLDLFFVEQLCEFKNNAFISKLGANLNQDGKKMVAEVYATSPEEVRAYTDLAELGCSHFMPAEWLDGMDKFFHHPASTVLKVEVMKYRALVKKLDMFKVEPVVAV